MATKRGRDYANPIYIYRTYGVSEQCSYWVSSSTDF